MRRHWQERFRILAIVLVAMLSLVGCRRTNAPATQPAARAGAIASTQPAANFQREPRHITLAADEVRLPIDLVTGMPVFTFEAADGTHHRLILDTGADSFVMSPALVAAHRLTTRPSDRVGNDPSGRHVGLPAARVPALELGVVRFEDFDADVEQIFAPCDGLLGWPLYRALLVTIDYPHRTAYFNCANGCNAAMARSRTRGITR